MKQRTPQGESEIVGPETGLRIEEFNLNYITFRGEEISSLSSLQGLDGEKSRVIAEIENLEEEISRLQEKFVRQKTKFSRLVRDVDTFKKTFNLVADSLEMARIAQMNQTSDIQIAGKAVVPKKPIDIPTVYKSVMAAMVGGLLGVVYIIVSNSVRTAQASPKTSNA